MRMRRNLRAKIRRRRGRRTVSDPTSRRKRRILRPIRQRPAIAPASAHRATAAGGPTPGARAVEARADAAGRVLAGDRAVSFQPPGGPPPPAGPPPPPPGNRIRRRAIRGPSSRGLSSSRGRSGPPPKKRGNGWKWGLGAVALLVVIGVTAAVTISVTRDGGGDGGPAPTGDTFGLASADDKGPANIITEDPSCAAGAGLMGHWRIHRRDGSIATRLYLPRSGRLTSVPSTTALADAMRDAADQSVQLAKLTPHRVVRELYEQFIAYARAYSDAIPTYTSRR